MAIIRPGPLAGAISGKLGGLVFVAGTGTPVVRPRPAANYKSSPSLQSARSRFAQLINHWRGLTDEQKAAWAVSAANFPTTNRLGATSPTSGFLHFLDVSTRARLTGAGINDLPNTLGTAPEPLAVTGAFSVSGSYAITANSGGAGLGQFFLYGQAFARNWPAKAAPRLRFLQSQFGSDINVDVKATWSPLFGEIQEDQQFVIGVAFARGSQFLSRTILSPHTAAIA